MGKLKKLPAHSFVGGKSKPITKHLRYNTSGEIINVIIEDYRGRRIDKFSCNIQDSRSYNRILLTLKNKYGLVFKPEIDPKNNISADPTKINWIGFS